MKALPMLQTVPQTLTPTPDTDENDSRRRIRELNDTFRTNGAPVCLFLGKKIVTPGIKALGGEAVVNILLHVMAFNEFSKDNDPWQEHDFGAFEYEGQKLFWKIDYYDLDYANGSPDAADPDVTRRVLTVMLADEY